MGYAAKILADSVSPHGRRLTTFEVTFPRIVLAEFNTHRMLSRNSASSRAIPVEKRIAMVEVDPFVPQSFGKNQKGMQASEALAGDESVAANNAWRLAARYATSCARDLAELGVHKQLANRLLEPFLWHTVIVSATEWSNFFALRCHPAAQPEIRTVAEMMRDLYAAATPRRVPVGEWHLPLVTEEEVSQLRGNIAFYSGLDPFGPSNVADVNPVLVSVGRCARVSYLTHDGRRDPHADQALARTLMSNGHLSPFEHAAQALGLANPDCGTGNFNGWLQARKIVPHESDFGKVVAGQGGAT